MMLSNSSIKAFLEMIRHSEGTAVPVGYRMMFGGKLFMVNKDPMDASKEIWDHPHVFFAYTNKAGKTIKTSASGAYQITYTTWVAIKERLGLTDFSPESQDIAALYLIAEKGAISLITTGHFLQALDKVREIWASLPGSGCNQPEHTLTEVETWYEDAGGVRLAA